VQVVTKQETEKLLSRSLPGFAAFLRKEKLIDYIKAQLYYSKELKLPLLRFFEGMNDEQIIQMSIPSHTEFLEAIINGNVTEHIENSNKKWLANQLQIVDKYDIVAEDISLASHIRKKAMQVFLPEYTNDLSDVLAIINEIDALNLEADINATNTYIQILKDKVTEHSHFIERITETSPGIIYVFDLLNDKEVYANNMMTQLLGYEPDDWKKLDKSFVEELIHPDDVAVIEANQKAFAHASDGDVLSIKYRIKDKSGHYRWMQTHESVFKRTADGATWQVIGIALDISTEKQTADQLQKREEQLLEAQALADIGSFVWNISTGEREATPQFYKILHVEKGIPLEAFLDNVHAADKVKVKTAFEATIQQRHLLDIEFRYKDSDKEKIVWFKAACRQNELNETIVQGTVMNVTDRHSIIQKLQRSEDINRKAQALTHLGNWTWDLINNKLEWSDELYRMYDLEPGTEIPHEFISAFNHPEDANMVSQIMAASMQHHQPHNFYYRIILKNGSIKTLHAIGEVLVDDSGKPYKMIGTLQDVSEREELINRLQRSEILYKQAQSIAHLGNWMFDVESEKLFWTDELYRIYGLEPQSEELNWKRFMDLVLKDDRELVTAFSEEAFKTGKPFEMYHRIKRISDDAIRTLHIRGEGLMNEDKKVYQLFGTSQDVTDQQHIEQELRQNQNFIKKIADATPSIIASYNINTGKYRFMSQGLKTLLGYEPEQVFEKGVEFVASLIHPDDINHVMEKNAKALELANLPENEDQDMVVDFQYRMKRSDGEYRWFHTFGTIFDRTSKGKVENVLNISIDITDRIKAEETVAEQQKFISHIAEASPTILYLFDLEQQKFLYLNKEVTVVLGYTPEEILSLGDKVYMYLHPEDTVKSPETYVKYKQDGAATMHQFEGRIRSRSGEWKWLLTREVVFKRNDDGKAIQVLGSALDITDRKEMEGTLSKKNAELEQSNANLEEFAFVASHDLQEPLRKISIFGDRLLVNHLENLDEDGQLFLQKIVDSSRRMQGMINDLLSVSLLTSDKSFEKQSLKVIVDDVLQTLEFKIESKKATITVDDLPEAHVISSQMRQLFQNLISNSLKFVAPGRDPQIAITQSNLSFEETNKLELQPAKQYVKIRVADNGIGFQNEYASKIFTIFQRLHGKFDYEGTGIGLAICKKIVEIHEGIIYAEGKPGEGSVFTIILPL
jgi:PAS domain S-box-containing protein